MTAPAVPLAFAELRLRLDHRFRETTAAGLTLSETEALRTGLDEVDRALRGGFPRGTIATVEGPASAGRAAIVARLLAVATRRGLGALVGVDLHAPALAAAGVRLERLVVVPRDDPRDQARAADILLRAGCVGVVVIPALPSGRGTGAAAWARLASLAHRAGALLVATGAVASNELGYAASVRVETSIARVRWNGPPGHLGELAGYDVQLAVRKHKRAAPGGSALVRCEPFAPRAPHVALRERDLVHEERTRVAVR